MGFCIDFNLNTSVKAALNRLKLPDIPALKLDDMAQKVAEFGFSRSTPILRKLLDDAMAFMSTMMGQLAGAINGMIDQALGEISYYTGLVSSFIAIIATAGDQMKLLMAAFVIEQLRRELRLRLFFYYLMRWHFKQMGNALAEYTKPNKPSYFKLKMALYRVRAADKLFDQYNKGSESGITVSMRSRFARSAFKNIENAIHTLSRGDVDNEAAFRTIFDPAMIKNNNTPLPPHYGRRVKDAIGTMQRSFNKNVLGKSLYIIEVMYWNITQLITYIPIPSRFVTYNHEVTKYLERALVGYEGPQFDKGAMEKELDKIKRTSVASVDPTTQAVNTYAREFQYYDLAKGLIATNVLADSLAEQVLNFDVDWANFQSSAQTFMNKLGPAAKAVKEVRASMEESLRSGDSELILASKDAMWITLLNGAYMMQPGFQSVATLGASQDQAISLQQLQKEIKEYKKVAIDAQLSEILLKSLPAMAGAPLSETWMKEALVLCRTMEKILTKSIASNQRLMRATLQVDLSSNPAYRALTTMLNELAKLGPPASSLAQAFMTGQIAAFSGTLVSAVATGKAIVDNINKLDCPSNTNVSGEAINQNALNMERSKYAQERQASPVT